MQAAPPIADEFPASRETVPPADQSGRDRRASPLSQPRLAGSDDTGSKSVASAKPFPDVSPDGSGDGPRIYRIRDGDTLMRIAERYLGDSRRWPEILAGDVLRDPELVPVGKELRIPSTPRESAIPAGPPPASLATPPVTKLVPVE
jgi:nucleoid-associated protein YgaU